MIISHKLQIIVIAPIKVSISSFSTALEYYCGEGDVKPHADCPESQHKFVSHYNGNDFKNGHMSASEIKHKIPKNIWNNYLKISILRCVYDSIISLYYFEYKGLNKPFPRSYNEYVLCSGNKKIEDNFRRLCDGQKCIVDFIIRYENADEDIMALEKRWAVSGY